MTRKEEYFEELAYYRSENFWPEFWQKVNAQLSQEIKLLKDVCQDPYDQACDIFQSNHELKRQNFFNSYRQAQQLVQKGFDEAWSWRIAQQLVQKGFEALSESLVHLLLEQKAQGYDEVASERFVQLLEQGYDEALLFRFLNGKLIYKPNKENDVGRIELPIASLLNPLEGTFDLSRLGDAGQCLSISTGYRKEKIAANSNKSEVWIVPKFVVDREVGSTARHYRDIMSKWTAPIGLFFTWGDWDNLEWCDYLVTASPEAISSKNLYENWDASKTSRPRVGARLAPAIFSSILIKF
jgi:hypothetical protein